MILGGLDIATTTGLCVLDGDSVLASTWKAPKRKGQIFEDERETSIDPKHSGAVGRAFEDHLVAWIRSHGVQHVAIEMPLRSNAKKTVTTVDAAATWAGKAVRKEVKDITSMATIYRLYGLSFVACSVCARLNVPVEIVNQSEWRKAFLGNGSPKDAKKAAVEQCRRLRIPFSSVDSCEAVGIAWWLRGHLNPAKFKRGNDLFSLPPSGGLAATASA